MIAGQLELQMFANLARLQSDMDSAKRLVGGATQQIESAAAKATAALAGIGIGLSVAQFAGMIRGSIDAADKLNDLSKSTGLAIETLSGLKLASKQSGADLDGTAASINKLSVNIGKNSEKFAALGVTAKDPLEAFKQLSDVFKNIDDPQLRAAVGAEALGKSWASAAPLLMEGGAEIQAMVDKGTKLAGVTTAMAEQADAFNDKWEELVGTGGLVNGVTTSLLPVFNVLIDDMLALRGGTKETTDEFSYFAETLKAVVVLGGNVAFALKGVATEVSGITTQINLMKIGEFGLAFSVGEKMKTDAAVARKEFDAWESRVMNAGKGFSNKVSSLAAEAGDPGAFAKLANANSAASAAARGRAFVTTGKDAKAEKISEYTRMEEAIKKVTAVQEQELLYGGKLVASDKFRIDELQKITFAFATHKISQQERLRLIELTTIAAGKMLEVEKQAAAVKANQANYAEQIEFAKELADSEVSLSKAREDGRQILMDYAQAIGADNEFTALQLSLVGQTEDAKERAIALYRIELELKKQIAAINANAGFDGGQRDEAIAAATATAVSAKAGATSKIQLAAAEKAQKEQIDLWKQIDSTAESVFMNVYQNGSKAFKGIADDLKNTLGKALYELTVKPFIVQMATSFSGNAAGSAVSGGGNPLMSLLKGLSGGSSGSKSLGSSDFGGRADDSALALDGVGDSLDKLGEASGLSVASLIAQTIATVQMGLAALAAAAQMAVAFVIANPVTSFFIAAGAAIAALFSFGKKEAPTVLNNLELFNNSLKGIPFLELSLSSDEAAQGLRDVLYGLDNATPTMRKLAGETVSLSIELLRATGDIAGAANLARNLGTRGMSKEEIAVYDYNNKLREQIEAQRAGAAAAQAAASAEKQLASQRFALSNKLNVLLGRQTQLEADRAGQLAGVTDKAVLSLLKMTFKMEDLHTAADANYAKLERSIAKEKELATTRLKGATDLATALKTTKDAINPALDRATAQSQIAMYLALAKAGGVLPSAAALKPALDSIAKPSIELFKTFSEYAIDQARTANDIADLGGYADKQVSMEQQTLDRLDGTLETAKSQLDALKGIDNSVTSVTAAVAAFQLSMEALAAAKVSAGTYNYAAPMSGGSGGGGGYYGGSASGAAAGKYQDIAGQDNKDIIAAYREYYSRNPDASGYDYFNKSNMTGDALTQAILKASSGDVNGADYKRAVANGYDPMNPLANYYKSKNKSSGAISEDFGSFAVGSNFIPNDMIAQIHRGEEITPRPYVDLQRASREESNRLMQRLVESNERLEKKVEALESPAISNANHSSKTASLLDDVVNGNRSINTTSEATA